VFFFNNDLDECIGKITPTLTLKLWTNERSKFGAEYLRYDPNPGIATPR
jgi:hypothetical protein